MKTCTKCSESKDESSFSFDRKRGYYIARCKSCTREDKQNRYKNNPQYKESNRMRRQTPHGRYLRLKEDCKKRNIILDISEEQYIELIKNQCTYCSNMLGMKAKYGVGLDRLDSSLGYELTNVVPCCNFCNTIKGFLLTPDEMKMVAKLLIQERCNLSPTDSIKLKENLVKSRKRPLD